MVLTIFRLKGLIYHLVLMGLLGLGIFFWKGKIALISFGVGSGLVGINFLFFPILWDFYFIKKYRFFSALFFILKYFVLGLGFYFFWSFSEVHVLSLSIGLFSVLLTWVLLILL